MFFRNPPLFLVFKIQNTPIKDVPCWSYSLLFDKTLAMFWFLVMQIYVFQWLVFLVTSFGFRDDSSVWESHAQVTRMFQNERRVTRFCVFSHLLQSLNGLQNNQVCFSMLFVDCLLLCLSRREVILDARSSSSLKSHLYLCCMLSGRMY